MAGGGRSKQLTSTLYELKPGKRDSMDALVLFEDKDERNEENEDVRNTDVEYSLKSSHNILIIYNNVYYINYIT